MTTGQPGPRVTQLAPGARCVTRTPPTTYAQWLEEEKVLIAEFWDSYLKRRGLDEYMEVRYGLGKHKRPAELRVSEQPAVER